MPLVTRNLNNTGQPLLGPGGTVLSGINITFTLVTPGGRPADAWDATTFQRVTPTAITVTTNGSGEFSTNLWPNSRGNIATAYLCHVDYPNVRDFTAVIDDVAPALKWVDFMANGVPMTPQQLSFWAQLISSIGATLIGYILGVAGSIARSIWHRLAETPTLKDFGGKCDSATNDDAAWALAVAALNAGTISHLFVSGWSVTAVDVPAITRADVTLHSIGRRRGGILLTNNNNGLWFKATDPTTTQTWGLSLRGFGIWCTKTNPSAGIALRVSRGVQCDFDVALRDVFRGLVIESGGDQRYTKLDVNASPSWAALAVGSCLVEVTNYPGVNEVPSEIFMQGANIKGSTGAYGNPHYLENALKASTFDGLWIEGSHIGFANNAGLWLVPQNNASLWMNSLFAAGCYFDGSGAGDTTKAGVLLEGSTTPPIANFDFTGATSRAWAGKGMRFNNTSLRGLRIGGPASVQVNGKDAIELIGVQGFTLDVETGGNNNTALGVANDITLSGCSKGRVAGVNLTGTVTHPVGVSVDATCSDIVLGPIVSEGHTNHFSIAAGAARITFDPSNRMVGGNPTCASANPLVPPQGFREVIVTGSVAFDTITYPGASHGMELVLIFSGSPVITTGGNIGLGSATTLTPTGPLHLVYNGGTWQATNLAANYTQNSFTGTGTGFTASPTGTFFYTIVGNTVLLDLGLITGTSNNAAFTVTGAPAVIRPTNTKSFPVRIQDNGGAFSYGLGQMDAAGVLTIYKDPNGAAFTAAGTKTLAATSVGYTLT